MSCAPPKHGEDVVADKFFAQVINEDVLHASCLCLLAGRLQFLTLQILIIRVSNAADKKDNPTT